MSIGVLMDELPYPVRKNGIALRYQPLLLALSRLTDLELYVMPPPGDSLNHEHVGELRKLGVSTTVIDAPPRFNPTLLKRVRTHAAAWSPFGPPLSEISPSEAQIGARLRAAANFADHDAMLVVGTPMLRVLLTMDRRSRPDRIFCDHIDSRALILDRRARTEPSVRHWIEAVKARRWERSLMQMANGNIFVSPVDAAAAGSRALTKVVPNGIEHTDFASATPASLERSTVGFVGHMSYEPNVTGCVWFLREVWPRFVARRPTHQFMIIGRNPHERVRYAASRSRNVVITGEVDNIWSYYKAIDVFVGPLLTGGGLQNKVIEAMFANKLVICTSIANGGVEAINGESVVIADTADAFVDALDEAFADPGRRTRIASRGAEYARIKFDWESIAADLYGFISAAERC